MEGDKEVVAHMEALALQDEWSSCRNTGPKRECSTEAGKPVFEMIGTTEFIF